MEHHVVPICIIYNSTRRIIGEPKGTSFVEKALETESFLYLHVAFAFVSISGYPAWNPISG